jgi:putative transposase
MRKSRFSDEQILAMVREAEGGNVAEVCRRHGISKETLRRWRTKCQGMALPDARRLRQLEDENRRLKRVVADQALVRALGQGLFSERRRVFRTSQPRLGRPCNSCCHSFKN